MLALTRKVGEKIIINDNISITIVDIKGDNIRLGIEAPRDIKIYRGELYDSIVAENKQSAKPVDLAKLDLLQEIRVK